MMDKQGVNQRIVLITGAGKGAGRKLAEAFAAQGAYVALNDISPINVEELAAQIRARGGRVGVYVDDVAKKVAAQAIIRQVEDDFGRIDVLVNHAAVEPRFPLLDMDEWDWHRVMDVNLTGAFLMTQSVGRLMRSQGGGVIINLISRVGHRVMKDRIAFFASMAALESFSQQATRELEQYGIRVYTVASDEEIEHILALCRE